MDPVCEICGIFQSAHSDYRERHRFVAAAPRSQPAYKKRRALLKAWNILDSERIGGLRLQLRGRAYGHESYVDGEVVTTSPLLRLDIPARTAETINTVYVLG